MTQVTETLNEGLKREYAIVIAAADLASSLDAKLEELKGRVQINGFRPGKVPTSHMKRTYGRSVMADIINEKVGELTRSIANDNGIKFATEPKINFPEDQAEVEAVIDGKKDLAYTVAVEVLPTITIGDFKTISVEKPVTKVSDADIADALKRIGDQNKPFAARAEGAKAEGNDRVTIDYAGSIDGVAFDGGTDQDAQLVLGSGTFIPGFEEQIIGAKVGDSINVNVTFPEQYQAAHLAGKAAVFAVTVKEIAAPGEATIDDAFAASLGLENLETLKEAIKDQIGREDAAASRRKVKRVLLDRLDEAYTFDLPPTLVEQEFAIIWQNILSDMQRAGRTFADEGTTEEAAKADYQKIANRRVRLGLLLAEIGEKNQVQVTDEEVNRALIERVRQFPGQERQVFEFYRKNQQAMAELRAPLFEEKVVDYILELANVTEKEVSREDLFKEEDEGDAAEAKTEEKPKKKATKKAAAEPASE